MTNEEAKALFEEDLKDGKCSNDCPECNAREKAISALDKRIPKVAEHEDGVWSICPCCGGSVCNDTEHAVNGEVSYCEHCGQAIDWENSTFD